MCCVSAVTSIDSPAGVSEAFVAAIHAGNLPSALGLYRENAVLLAPDGQCARGVQAIAELLRGLLAMQVEMETRIENVIEAGDIAVASEEWTMRLRAPDGTSKRAARRVDRPLHPHSRRLAVSHRRPLRTLSRRP